jgi:hypothetical protein
MMIPQQKYFRPHIKLIFRIGLLFDKMIIPEPKSFSGIQRPDTAVSTPRVNAAPGSLDVLSSLIPPPPKASQRVASDASDDDWN